MDPHPTAQRWLEAWVGQHAQDLARTRGYLELAVADSMQWLRRRRPRPLLVPGEVLAMNVRDDVFVRADNPIFGSTGLTVLRKHGSNGVWLVDQATGVQCPVRKWPDPGPCAKAMAKVSDKAVQGVLFQPLTGGAVPYALTLSVYWSVQHDLLQDCHAVLVDGLGSPAERASIHARVELPELGLGSIAGPITPMPGDDFEDLVLPVDEAKDTGTEQDS